MFYRHFGRRTLVKHFGKVSFHVIHNDEKALLILDIDYFIYLIGVVIVFHLGEISQYLYFTNNLYRSHLIIKNILHKFNCDHFTAFTVSSLYHLARGAETNQLFELVPIFN